MKKLTTRYTGIPPVNRGDGVARKNNNGKQGKPVNWRPVNRDIDCTNEVCLQGTYLMIPVFGSANSHQFSKVTPWCRMCYACAHSVGHQDTVIIYRFYAPL